MKKILVLFLLASCNPLGVDPFCKDKPKISREAFIQGCFVGAKFFIEYGMRQPIPQGQLGELMAICDRFYVDSKKLEI